MVRSIVAVWLAALCVCAQAQAPVTEKQAQSYIQGGFLTDSAHAILSAQVKLGPELERRLGLAPGADSRAIYDALIRLTDASQVDVRKATPEDLAGYFRAGELQQPLYVLESGSSALLIQYDLRANNIPFVGLLPIDPSARRAAIAAAQKPPGAAKPVVIAAAPGSWLRIPGVTPYRIDIQQGNNLTAEAVSQLKLGLSKDQVRALLGTPLLASIFHAERWDYLYFREHPDGKRESRKLTVFFEDGRLARVDGDAAQWKEAN
jgi:outer membrane protein assembly factor BamE (lipoprotein component of BamABCDE complex)